MEQMSSSSGPSEKIINETDTLTRKGVAYWSKQSAALEKLRSEVLYPYFNMVEELRVTTQRAIDVNEIVERSFS
jgi:hypothetical protein